MAAAAVLANPADRSTPEECLVVKAECVQAPDGELEDEAEGGASNVPTMSKNQLKKLRRKERTIVKNAYKKAKEKEKKKAVAEERKKAVHEVLAGMSKEERDAEYQRRREGTIQRLHEKEQKKARQKQALEGGQDLVIDLEFGDLMEPHERKSLMQQLMYCYNRNSQAQLPYRLCLTGVTGAMKEQVHNICGFQNWLVVSEERPYLERFADRKDDLVYLTADAEETIQELDASKVYIIGGIVDRNRHKRLTYTKAKEQGIATAKLPIGEHLRLASSKVLTVNHVVELMVQYNELKDWQKALELVVPTRKRAGEEQDRPGTRPRVETGEGTDRQVEETAKVEGESGQERERSGEAREDQGDGEMLCSVREEGLESACKTAEGVVQEKRPGGGKRKGKGTDGQGKESTETPGKVGKGGLEGLEVESAYEDGESNKVGQTLCSFGGETLESVQHGDAKDPKELDLT